MAARNASASRCSWAAGGAWGPGVAGGAPGKGSEGEEGMKAFIEKRKPSWQQ
jgi:1,4-dihydroxy-2-naphthoyl-CoA synthase